MINASKTLLIGLCRDQQGAIPRIEDRQSLAVALSELLPNNSPNHHIEKTLVVSGSRTNATQLHTLDFETRLPSIIADGLTDDVFCRSKWVSPIIHQSINTLPFTSGAYSSVISVFGSLSMSNARTSAAELLRVTAIDGSLTILCWVPGGITGELMNLISSNAELSVFEKRCEYWGTRYGIRTLFDPALVNTESTEKCLHFNFHSPQQWLSLIHDVFLPVKIAYSELDYAGVTNLTGRLLRHARKLEHSMGTGAEVPMKLLQTRIIRRNVV